MRIKISTAAKQLFRRTKEVKIQKKIHNSLIRLWQDAIQEFIKTVLNNIGVESGMSGATLKPLAKDVRLKTYVEQSLRGRGAKFSKSRYSSTRFPGDSDTKSKSHGERLGASAYEINYGTPKVPRLTFTFQIKVLQFYLNELGIGNNNTAAWNSLPKGEQAAIDFINNNFQNYINDQEFINILLGSSGRNLNVTGVLTDA